jgi:succinate dehydrogenase/fumarate reductase flavoprotein subunit
MPIDFRGGLTKVRPAQGDASVGGNRRVAWQPLEATVSERVTRDHEVTYRAAGRLLRLLLDDQDRLLGVELLDVKPGDKHLRKAGERHVIINIGGGAVDCDKSGGGTDVSNSGQGIRED